MSSIHINISIRKALHLVAAVSACSTAMADVYLQEDFTNGMPENFTLSKPETSVIKPEIYANIDEEANQPWTTGRLLDYGVAALSPTRSQDGTAAAHRMQLPSVRVADADAVLRWQARSLHKHIGESYRVEAKAVGDSQWQELFSTEAETHHFTMRYASLADYCGKDVEIAFVATTADGFMLAIDNVIVGTPDDDAFELVNATPHYVGDDESVKVQGTLRFFGAQSRRTQLHLTAGEQTDIVQLPEMACGDEFQFEIPIAIANGEVVEYNLSALDADGNTTDLTSDFISCSYFPRMHVIDRTSGTWCNSCPMMELSVAKLERIYGDQVAIVEAHVRDKLTNADYWDNYLSDGVYNIPSLIPNHDFKLLRYALLGADEDFSEALATSTIAKIEGKATMGENGEINVSTTSTFGINYDNNSDIYRIAYMTVGDVHDPDNGSYKQRSSAMVYNYEQFYYQASDIKPEMMYFDNVPLEASMAYRGIPASLPKQIEAYEEYDYAFSAPQPEAADATNMRVLAMIVNYATGRIANAAWLPVGAPAAAADIIADGDSEPAQHFDILGRKITPSAPGIHIERRGAKTIKTLKRK